MTTNQAPKDTVLKDDQIAKTLAEEFASWTKWDTATNVCETPSGNEPDEERAYWLELVARTRALLSAQPEAAPQAWDAKDAATEYAWLIEKKGPQYYSIDEVGMFCWTFDHNNALRFARRIDADAVAGGMEDDGKAVEHGWG